jgi:hypothetical protein
MTTAQERHDALDQFMAAYASHTGRLFSTSSVLDLAAFVSELRPERATLRAFVELLDAATNAGCDTSQATIMDLVTWSHRQVLTERFQE